MMTRKSVAPFSDFIPSPSFILLPSVYPCSFLVYSGASGLATVPWTLVYVYVGTFSTDIYSLAQGNIR